MSNKFFTQVFLYTSNLSCSDPDYFLYKLPKNSLLECFIRRIGNPVSTQSNQSLFKDFCGGNESSGLL